MVLSSDASRRLWTDLVQAAPGLLSIDGSLAHCSEDRRQIRHHRIVGGFVNSHGHQAAGQAVAERRDETRCALRRQGGLELNQDVPEQIDAHCDRVKFV